MRSLLKAKFQQEVTENAFARRVNVAFADVSQEVQKGTYSDYGTVTVQISSGGVVMHTGSFSRATAEGRAAIAKFVEENSHGSLTDVTYKIWVDGKAIPVSAAEVYSKAPIVQEFEAAIGHRVESTIAGETSTFDRVLDDAQLAFDILSLMPGIVGEVSLVASAGVAILRDDKLSASLSFLAAIHAAGGFAAAAKLITKSLGSASKFLKNPKLVARIIKSLSESKADANVFTAIKEGSETDLAAELSQTGAIAADNVRNSGVTAEKAAAILKEAKGGKFAEETDKVIDDVFKKGPSDSLDKPWEHSANRREPVASSVGDVGGSDGAGAGGSSGTGEDAGGSYEDQAIGGGSSQNAPGIADEFSRLPGGKGSPGKWSGERGNSSFTPDDSARWALNPGESVSFENGYPNFSKWAERRFEVPALKGGRGDFGEIYKEMFRRYPNEFKDPTAAKNWLSKNKLTPHHVPGTKDIEIIPTKLNRLPHKGGSYDLRLNGENP